MTLNFNDAAASFIPQSVPLGAPGSSVTTKPVDYPGFDSNSFPAPAPAGPYGTPAPEGSATLSSTFASSNPDGTWSLYVVTDGPATASDPLPAVGAWTSPSPPRACRSARWRPPPGWWGKPTPPAPAPPPPSPPPIRSTPHPPPVLAPSTPRPGWLASRPRAAASWMLLSPATATTRPPIPLSRRSRLSATRGHPPRSRPRSATARSASVGGRPPPTARPSSPTTSMWARRRAARHCWPTRATPTRPTPSARSPMAPRTSSR